MGGVEGPEVCVCSQSLHCMPPAPCSWIVSWALIPYYVLRVQPKRPLTFWSTSKLRTLNSIFTFEYRFLWKAQSILKSWMDNLKVIYSWLIFRDQKKYPIQEYFSDLLNTILIRTWLNFHSLSSYLSSFITSRWNVTGHVELCSSATRIEMIYFYGKTASLRWSFSCWAICSDGWYKEQ